MIVSIYSELAQYEEVAGDMVERIRELAVYDIFEKLHLYYGEEYQLFNKALFFILHCYTKKSKFHVLDQSWADIKERVAAHLGINMETPFVNRPIDRDLENTEKVLLYDDLVSMQSRDVIETISRYLLYQGNKNFRHLCMIKDQYEQMVSGALDLIKKSTGEIDYDQKNKNRKYATEILAEIGEWEQKIADNDDELKDARIELKKQQSTGGNSKSMRMEDHIKQRP